MRRLRSVTQQPDGQPAPEPAGLRPLDGLILAATRQAQWLEPGWYFYHDFLARLLDRRGLTEAAARELAAGYALMPRPSAHDVLGEDLLRRYPDALEAGLARAEAEGRLDPVSLAWGRAETREFLGQDDAALAAWRDLSGLVDRESRALTDYAAVRILSRAGRDEDSLVASDRFLDQHAGNRLEPGVLNLRARAFSRLGRHQEALEALRLALGVSPRPAAVLILMGRESELLGDQAEAERLYRAALAREPDWLTGVRTLALFLERAGRAPEALEVARSHARRHPDDAAAAELLRSLAGSAGE
jgi:tetratricopeptide (TPR) repeat protein